MRIFVVKKKPKARFTAKNSDRHDLYQRSVQAPEFEVEFFDRTFRKLRKRRALSMREDFCGTALVSTTWVESRKDRTATGVDIDPEGVQWGSDNDMAHLVEPGERLTLEQRDVSQVTRRKYGLINAMR